LRFPKGSQSPFLGPDMAQKLEETQAQLKEVSRKRI